MMTHSLQHDLNDTLDSHDREELEDFFSFTTPTIEFTTTSVETLTQTTSAGDLDDLYDFEHPGGFATAPSSDTTLVDPTSSWESILSTFKDDSTLTPSSNSLQNHQETTSLDKDTRDILDWLDKTNKPSKKQTHNLGDGEEIYRLLENEIHQIFEGMTDGTANASSLLPTQQQQQLNGSHQSNEISHSDSRDMENGINRNHETWFTTCKVAIDDNSRSTLAQVVRSTDSTVAKDIRPLLHSERRIIHPSDSNKVSLLHISTHDRPHLWTKVLCSNKTMKDVQQSSLVDSFIHFHKTFDFQAFSRECQRQEDDMDAAISSDTMSLSRCILEEATALAPYKQLDLQQNFQPLSSNLDHDGDNLSVTAVSTEDSMCRNLCSLLVFYYQNDNTSKILTTHSNVSYKDKWNTLIGPVIATLLSASIPVEIVSIMTSTIGPVAMPLIALTNEERRTATTRLHKYFYQLACYHNPILILHLDRYAPGWFLPRVDPIDMKEDNSDEDGKDTGTIPITWFSSLLAGECLSKQPPKTLTLELLRQYWDASFLSQDNSLKFFLAAALLQVHADKLLTLRGLELVDELTGLMTFQRTSPNSASLALEDDQTECFMGLWFREAKLLQESTPRMFLELLKEAENDVVKTAIMLRQKMLLDKEEREEAERRKQVEAERIQKEEEALNRSYLVSFYEKYAPDKLSTVDNILKVYSGRIPLLNQRLKEKYGVGFLPVSVAKPAAIAAIKTLKQSIQQGLKSIHERDADKRVESTIQDETLCPSNHVALLSSPSEVLSSFFADEISKLPSSHQKQDENFPYCIIDSRSDDIASIQGRFLNTIALNPETLDDPLRMNELRSQLESLRGDHHICIMGQGTSLSKLNGNYTLDEEDRRLQDLDDTRTSKCALFFINEGFPYVSIVEGGFAAAYSWLQQSFPSLESSVVTDISRSLSSSSIDSTTDKTSRTVQKLLDRSMVALTLGEQKIEESLTKLFASKGGSATKKV